MTATQRAHSSDTVSASTPVPSADDIEVRLLRAHQGAAVRQFCLDVIAEVFGHGYRPDWHADLDGIERNNHYFVPDRGGTFLVVLAENRIVGTVGLRSLTTSPHLAHRFADRYLRPAEVGAVSRLYLDPAYREHGIGTGLSEAVDRLAVGFGYETLYLHTSASSPRSVSFWQRQGYSCFAADDDADTTVHFDKWVG